MEMMNVDVVESRGRGIAQVTTHSRYEIGWLPNIVWFARMMFLSTKNKRWKMIKLRQCDKIQNFEEYRSEMIFEEISNWMRYKMIKSIINIQIEFKLSSKNMKNINS